MLDKVLSAYLSSLVFVCSGYASSSGNGEEELRKAVGDAIWLCAFIVNGVLYCLFLGVFLLFDGMPSVSGIIWITIGVTVYALVIVLHYFYVKSIVGYDYIFRKLQDPEYLLSGRRNLAKLGLFFFFLFVSTITILITS